MLQKIKFPTLKYKYDDDEEEFIFCIKGRPFPCLVSSKLPTPTSTIIDYGLVRDLGLKMTNLQCQKFQFASHKMRILGTVSITVQCIVDGSMCGTTRLKADVVLDLAKNLDTECVAGTKMAAQLKGITICTSSGALTPPRATTPPPKSSPTPSPPPTQPKSSPRPSPTTPRSASPPRPISPPGFPSEPQHLQVQTVSQVDAVSLSPYITNIRRLTGIISNADLQPNTKREMDMLCAHDKHWGEKWCDTDYDDQGKFVLYKADGTYYHQGHGREKCRPVKCVISGQTARPVNCGFNYDQYQIPETFKPCGKFCIGAFCGCINNYI